MPHLMAQVRLKRVNNVPEDAVINTFHFVSADGDQLPIAEDIKNRLANFWNVVPQAGGSALRAYMSSLLSQTGHEVRVYNMADPKPRAPIYTGTWDFSGALGSTNVAPAEVSICLSFKAPGLSGFPAARRRGRVFIGPLAPSITIASGDARPSTAMLDSLLDAGKRLRDGSGATWSVFSPTANHISTVKTVQVDDSFDTQRRRGGASTLRREHTAP